MIRSYFKLQIKTPVFFKLLLLSLMILSTNCSDDFLEWLPVNAISADNYYRNEAQIQKALTAAYSTLGNRGMAGWWQPLIRNVRSDNCETVEGNIISHHTFTVIDTDIRLFNRNNGDGLWNSIYVGILRCNLIIRNTPSATILSEENRKKLIGQAYFLRALYYFYLVDYWNQAPVLLENNFDAVDVAIRDRAFLFSVIESDLNQVIDQELLPTAYSGAAGDEIGRATMGAAKSLLGKVYLFQGKFNEASLLFADVVNSGVYSLQPLDEIWTVDGENGSESVFEVQFNNTGAGPNPFFDDGVQAAETTLRNQSIAPNQYNGWENAWPSQSLLDEYEAGDLRRSAFIVIPGENFPTRSEPFEGSARNRGNYAIKKGMGSGFSTGTPNGTGEENFPIVRYADVLLMYAESLIRGGGSTALAIDLIDQVRARGFGYETVVALRNDNRGIESFALNNDIDLFEALKRERRRELCFEGHRYSDLMRWGDVPNNPILVDRGWTPQTAFYPISREDIDLSSLID